MCQVKMSKVNISKDWYTAIAYIFVVRYTFSSSETHFAEGNIAILVESHDGQREALHQLLYFFYVP